MVSVGRMKTGGCIVLTLCLIGWRYQKLKRISLINIKMTKAERRADVLKYIEDVLRASNGKVKVVFLSNDDYRSLLSDNAPNIHNGEYIYYAGVRIYSEKCLEKEE
jgi:hypothetical protein